MKRIFPIVLFVVLLSTSATIFAQQTPGNFVWLVYKFDFECPQAGANKKIASYDLSWENNKKPTTRFERCSTDRGNPMYNGRGFAVRIRLNKPLNTLKIGRTQNCTVSRICYDEPPEYNDDRYRRVNLSWY